MKLTRFGTSFSATFFAFGGQQLPFQTGPLSTITPSYDAFRSEFPDHVKAGMAVPVPPFIASGSFDIDRSATMVFGRCHIARANAGPSCAHPPERE